MVRKIITQTTTSGQDSKSIFRTPKRKNFVSISNALAQNDALSLEAKGLMLLVLSLPEDWQFYVGWLRSKAHVGRDKMQRILRSLEASGYLQRGCRQSAQGRFEWEYRFLETPEPLPEKPSPVEPSAGEPSPENQAINKEPIPQNEPVSTKKQKKGRGAPTTTTNKKTGGWCSPLSLSFG